MAQPEPSAADKAKAMGIYIVQNPGEMAKAMMLPPPGTDPEVQGLYYAQNAVMGLDVARWAGKKALKTRAGTFVSRKVAQRLANKIIVKETKRVLSLVGRRATAAARQLALKALIIFSEKLAARTALLASFGAAAGPISEAVFMVVDAVITVLSIGGLLFSLFDTNNLTDAFTHDQVKEIIDGLKKPVDEAYAKAGLPGYFSEEATFPVETVVFEYDTMGNLTTTPVWGKRYNELQDEYMKSIGFDKNWRQVYEDANAADIIQQTKVPEPGPDKKRIVVGLVLLCCLLGIGFIIFLLIVNGDGQGANN